MPARSACKVTQVGSQTGEWHFLIKREDRPKKSEQQKQEEWLPAIIATPFEKIQYIMNSFQFKT